MPDTPQETTAPASPPAKFTWAEWYKVHGEAYNEERRAKYENDPEHREKVRAQNAASRKKKKKEEAEEAAKAHKARKVGGRRARWKEMEIEEGGRKVMAFSISALALTLQRSIQSIRLWEKTGLIPGPNAISPKNDRLYTAERIEEIHEKLQADGRLTVTRRQRRGPPHVAKVIRFANGEERSEVMFLIAALAETLDRTIVTVQQMEKRGIIPETPFRASEARRYRLYTLEQIQAVKLRLDAEGGVPRTEEAKKKFHDAVLADWAALHIVGAKIVEA